MDILKIKKMGGSIRSAFFKPTTLKWIRHTKLESLAQL